MENLSENNLSSDADTKINNLVATVQKYETFCQQLVISNRNLKTEVKKLHKVNDDILNSIYNIESEMISANQYNRRENLEFVNIPESFSQKELELLLLKIFNSMKIPMQSYDIVAVHRIGASKSNQPRNVIMRFINRKNAFRVMKNKKLLNTTGTKFKLNNLYVIENLCRVNKNIFNKFYKLKKTGVINNVWSNYGVFSIQLGLWCSG